MKARGTPTREIIVIREGDALRSVVETFIRNVYATEYGAQLQTFPSRLFALTNEGSEIICAAGVRLQEDGFFSELYLDSPIEQVLGTASNRTIAPAKSSKSRLSQAEPLARQCNSSSHSDSSAS